MSPASFPRQRQRGASAVEFILVAIPVLLAGLGIIEASRWYFIKQAISLALLEAGRAGITGHAHPLLIEAAFERGLQPLFPPTETQTSRQRLAQAQSRQQADLGAIPWRIQILTPTPAMFEDFFSPQPPPGAPAGQIAINNDYQAEQHLAYIQQGRPEGRGPLSGATVFQANTLQLQLTYPLRPLLPALASLLRWLSSHSSGYRRQALAAGYLPLEQSLLLTMQSHPVLWDKLSGKVYRPDQAAPAPVPGAADLTDCLGAWCPRLGLLMSGRAFSAEPATTPDSSPHDLDGPNHHPIVAPSPFNPLDVGLPDSSTHPHPATGPLNPPGTPDTTLPVSDPNHAESLLPGLDDPACGVSLCCLGP